MLRDAMNWNGFRGTAKRLDDIDLPKIGAQIGVGEDEIHAVMDVEAAGAGFDAKGRPRILFERHWFYRLVPDHKRAQAVKEGLAVKKWSRATYGKDQYQLLDRAMKIDEEAALKSASWGLGQVMGFNHKKAGFATVQDMIRAFMADEERHLQAMVNFIKNTGLDDELRRHDWAGFARGYNGAGYKANRYDAKLAASFAKWSRIKDTPFNSIADKPVPTPTPRPAPFMPPKAKEIVEDAAKRGSKSTTNWTGLGGIVSTVLSALVDNKPAQIILIVAAVVLIGWVIRERLRKGRDARQALADIASMGEG